ncbi:MAG: HEPN domain-containing protein, partial [Candidatus Omnitrophica bacterium]|nr:HEPN domain-containing protein [Candidatus Omnitrophota bacterium]
VCFHSQQCVEKYLKALLQDENIYFEKTHDLDVLLEKAKNILPQLMEHKKQAVKLSSFAVEIRYPGVEATQEEAHLCLGIAEELRKVIRGHLGGEV